MFRIFLVILALAVILLFALAAIILVARAVAPTASDDIQVAGDKMQKIAFLLLLGLIAYVAATGMS